MLTSGELMDEAAAQTGLTDFGDDSFTDGLNVLLSALRDEAHLNERGKPFCANASRAISPNGCRSRTGFGGTRRSATCPSANRWSAWDCPGPDPPPCPCCWPRISRCATCAGGSRRNRAPALDGARRRSRVPADRGEMVGTRRHVPGDTHGPMECHELMALDFKSHIFQSFAEIPRTQRGSCTTPTSPRRFAISGG